MELPKFLLADNSAFPDKIFVVHTEYPRFILDIDLEEVEWLDPLEEDSESNINNDVAEILDEAYAFFDKEMESYEEEDENEGDL